MQPITCKQLYVLRRFFDLLRCFADVRERNLGNGNVVKNARQIENTRAQRNRDGGCSRASRGEAEAVSISRSGRQIRSFTYQFAKREIRDKHGPSPPRAD